MNQVSSPFSGIFSAVKSYFIKKNWKQWLPSRGNFLFILLITFGLVWAQSSGAFARNPAQSNGFARPIPYQGRLADAGGNPLTNTYPMIFRIYTASTGTEPLWEENWSGPNSVRVSDGLFSVMLGSLTPIPETIITNNEMLWLGITVGTDDEMAPRIQLGTVPYSQMAQSVPNGSISSAKVADGAIIQSKLDPSIVFVPDNSISTIKIADGAVTKTKLGSDVVFTPPDGSVTTQKIANGAVDASKLGSDVSNIFIQGGRLEVSENTSGYGLHTGYGERSFVTWVPFDQSFKSPPAVLVSLSKFNLLGSKNSCLDVYPQNISSAGFELVYHTWWDCTVYLVAASWVAYGAK
jgi:hypothetical protein